MITLTATSLRSRVARRIFGVFLLCALIPFAGLAIVTYHQVSAFFNEKTQRQLRAMAKTYGMDIYERLLLLESGLQILASQIQNKGTMPTEEALEALPSNPKARWDAVMVVTGSGQRHRLLGNVEAFPELTTAEKARLVFGKALILTRPTAPNQPARIYMGLIGDPRLSNPPIIIGKIKDSYVWSMMDTRIFPSHISPCILDGAGVALQCSFPGFGDLTSALLPKARRSSMGDLEWQQDGRDYQASYWTLPVKFEFQTSGWIVALLTSKEGIFASIRELRQTFVHWALVCVGLSVLFAMRQIRKRLVPVEMLQEGTQRITQNDFEFRVNIRSNDEFQELATSFNAMAAQLGQQFETLNTTAEIQRAVLSLLNTAKIADTILSRIMTVLRCQGATLTLLTVDGTASEQTFIVRDQRRVDSPPVGNTIPPAEKIPSYRNGTDGAFLAEVPSLKGVDLLAQRVAETKAPLVISDLSGEPQLRDAEFTNGFSSCLAAPLMLNDSTFGVLVFYSREKRLFSLDDIAFMTGLTSQAAIAIYNSRLYEHTKHQTVELEKANRVKDEFLGVISHELRTPLNVILGYVGMIQEEMLGSLNSDQAHALTIVGKNSRDLLAMIEGVIDVTKIESGSVVIENCEVNLLTFFGDLKSQYEVPLGKEIELVWDCPPALPVLRTDETKLTRILHNLIDNAIKFTDRGRVVVSARQSENQSLTFQVSDTGAGIPQGSLPVIFEMFRQLDSSKTREHEGFGLGLFVVKKLTDLLGGKIEVESELGIGTTFTLTFPACADSGAVSVI